MIEQGAWEHLTQKKQELKRQVEELVRRLDDVKRKDLAEEARDFLDRHVDAAQFSILCLGEFSTGKTTFINRILLGEDILPTRVRPTTARLTVVRRGKRMKARIVRKDGSVEEIEDAVRERLEAHVANGGWQVKNTVLVELEVPCEALPEGVIVVDAPGLNDPDEERMHPTYAYLDRADAVLFFMAANRAWTKSEKEFLKSRIFSRDDVHRIFFLLNYWDQVPEEEKNQVWEDVYLNINKVLSAHGKTLERESLIPISAKEGENVDKVKEIIFDYMASINGKIMLEQMDARWRALARRVRTELEKDLDLLQAEDAQLEAERRKLEEEIRKYKEGKDRMAARIESGLVRAWETMLDQMEDKLSDRIGRFRDNARRAWERARYDNEIKAFLHDLKEEYVATLRKMGSVIYRCQRSFLEEAARLVREERAWMRYGSIDKENIVDDAEYILEMVKKRGRAYYAMKAGEFSVEVTRWAGLGASGWYFWTTFSQALAAASQTGAIHGFWNWLVGLVTSQASVAASTQMAAIGTAAQLTLMSPASIAVVAAALGFFVSRKLKEKLNKKAWEMLGRAIDKAEDRLENYKEDSLSKIRDEGANVRADILDSVEYEVEGQLKNAEQRLKELQEQRNEEYRKQVREVVVYLESVA